MVPNASIVIPTWGRPKELNECLRSLQAQTVKDIQLILMTERGALTSLRNQGLQQACTPIVCFIDDDVVCQPTWLSNLLNIFQTSPQVVGVTGPAKIPWLYRPNRALFRHPTLSYLYNRCFVQPENRPGHLSSSGAFVPDPDYTYCGLVQFLEACNMSFRTEALRTVGGFDEAYGGIGDWSEPDCCFRLRQHYGSDSLRFDPTVAVEHHPSQHGATMYRRFDAQQRLSNYQLFSDRWIKPSWRHILYRLFLTSYYRGFQRWA